MRKATTNRSKNYLAKPLVDDKDAKIANLEDKIKEL